MAIKTPTIVAKVDLQVNKSFLRKQLDKVVDGYKTGGVVGAGKVVGEGAMAGLKELPSMLKNIVSGFGKVIGIATGIALIVEVFKPVYGLLEGVFKLLREFVRPIADVVTMLLQPILMLIRPIVMMFRTLMLPFRQLAYQGLAAANILITQGMQLGGEEGKQMVGEGFKGALSSASLMMSGFIRVIMQPLIDALDNTAIFSGIAEGFENAMDKWESSAVKGVIRTIVLADTFSTLIPILDDTRLAASKALNAIDEQMRLLEGVVDDWTVGNAPGILEAAGSAVDLAAGVVVSALEGPEGLEGHLENAESAAKNFAEALGVNEGNLIGRMQAATLKVDEFTASMKAFENINIKAMEQGQLQQFADDIAGQKGTSGRKKAWQTISLGASDFISGLGNLLAFEDKFKTSRLSEARESWITKEEAQFARYKEIAGELTPSLNAGLIEMLQDMDIYFGKSLIPESFLSGLQHMYNINDNFFNPDKGKLVLNTKSGYNSIENASNNFVKSMQSVASSIKSIASDAARYAAQARSAASSASASARAASAARSSY